MARLAWDAVQTAHAYLEHTGRVDERFPLESRRPPATPFTGLWIPVPHADSAAFLAALHHTPTTLVPTRPRGLPIRLARTTSLTLARPARASGLGTPAPSPPVPDPNTNTMSRSHSLPNRVPPAWHDVTPLVLDFPRGGHGDLGGTAGQPPRGPQYRPLLLHPTTRAAPSPQHNLDLALNDSDARFIASRLVATVAPIVAADPQADQLTDQESLADSDDDDDGHMSTGDDESRVCLGAATRRPSIAASSPRPASLLGMHATTQPAQATPLVEAQSTAAGAPPPPPGLDPRARVPMRAREGSAGSSGDMGPHTQAPTLVHLMTEGASSPLGPSDTHTSTRVALPAPLTERQRQHTTPPPIAPPRDSAGDGDGAAPRALVPTSPLFSAGDTAQQWTVTAGPARPAAPLASRGARPEQAAPLRAARLDTAPAPLAPVLDPGAHSPARAPGDDAGSSGGLDSQALAPALLRLTTSDAPSPLGLFGTSTGAHSPPPSPPVARQRHHTAPPPIVSPITAFLLHARQQAADGAVDPIPGAPAPAGVPRLPPLANSAEDDGAPDGVSQLPPSASSAAGDGAVAAPPVAATRKRKGRGKGNGVAQDERKRQRRQLPPHPQDDTEAGT